MDIVCWCRDAVADHMLHGTAIEGLEEAEAPSNEPLLQVDEGGDERGVVRCSARVELLGEAEGAQAGWVVYL